MRIVLQAFGNKLSGVMEVPEETGTRLRLALTQPIQVFNDGHGKEDVAMMNKPLETICEFEWTGKSFMASGHEYDGAREYQLISINSLK